MYVRLFYFNQTSPAARNIAKAGDCALLDM